MPFDFSTFTEVKIDADGLPSKLSDLIDVALRDLELCEANPKININMSVWYEKYHSKDYCSVCLAGAVLLQTLPKALVEGIKLNDYWCSDIFEMDGKNQRLEAKLCALDNIRMGEVHRALVNLGLVEEGSDNFYRYIEYWSGDVFHMYDEYESEPFKACIRKLAVDLRKDGF